jgi:hypothetical protein
MVLEVTLIDVLPGREGDFVDAYELARPLVATAPGCRSVRLQRAVESPGDSYSSPNGTASKPTSTISAALTVSPNGAP